jgi:hypothetical protein
MGRCHSTAKPLCPVVTTPAETECQGLNNGPFWIGFLFIQSSTTVHPQCIDIATGLKEHAYIGRKRNQTAKGEVNEYEHQKVSRNIGSVGGAAAGLRHSRLG